MRKIRFVATIETYEARISNSASKIPYMYCKLSTGHTAALSRQPIEIINKTLTAAFDLHGFDFDRVVGMKVPLIWEYTIKSSVDKTLHYSVRFVGVA